MGLQTKKLMYSKKQSINEQATYAMGDNICKPNKGLNIYIFIYIYILYIYIYMELLQLNSKKQAT